MGASLTTPSMTTSSGSTPTFGDTCRARNNTNNNSFHSRRESTSAYNRLFVTPHLPRLKNTPSLYGAKTTKKQPTPSLSTSSSMFGSAWNFAKKSTSNLPMRTKNSLNRLSSSSSVSSALSRSQDSAASLSFVSNASIDSSTDQLSASSSASSNCSSGDSGIVSRKGMSSSKSSIELVDKQNNSVKNAHSTSQRFSFFENNKNIFAGHKKEQSLGSRIVSVPLNNLKKSGCRVKEHLLSVTRPAKALSYQKSDLTNGNIDTATIESKFRREVHITNNNPDFTKENPYAYCRPATTKLTNNILLTSGNTPMTSSFSSAIFNFGVKTDIRQHDSIKRTIIHASTGEILKGIASLINYKCSCLRHFDTDQLTIWLRTVDRSLLVQGWQDIAFLNPANMVFFFMLVRSVLNEEEDFPIKNIGDLQSVVLTCLYVSYSYMGNEISYPLKPFILQQNRDKFWDLCLKIINKYSEDMLKLNSSANFFSQVLTDLKRLSSSQTF